VQSAVGQSEAAQPTTVQPTGAHAMGGQALDGQPTGGGWAARDRVIGDWAGTDWPSGDLLATTKPPKGPRTEPQPALPDTSVQSAVQATRYQAAVQATTTQQAVQATTTQQAVQPTAYQPAVAPTSVQQTVQPTTVQPMSGQPMGGVGADGTQVLFLGGDAWQMPGGAGAPGGPVQPNLYGYQEAQRRRRLWLIGGLGAGTAVAIAIIVVVATSSSNGGSKGAATADQTRVTTSPTPTATAATTASPTPSTSPSSSPSASATPPASVLSDGQSGLSYAQLASPWAAGCPSGLSSAFSWSAGESAVAGQVNSGQQTWYGEACSGPLPAQYNYTGVQDLENTATTVAQTLENAYYNGLDHTPQPLLSQPISVSGHAGWEIEYSINYTNAAAQGATWTSEEGAVVVADTGTGNTPVVFFSSIPDTLGVTNVNSLVSSLQLTVVPNPDITDGDGSPAPGGSPAD
jgi:hypothetical protein